MSSRTFQLLIQTLNANRNYQIKWYGQFSLLFYSSFSFTWHLSRVCEKVNWKIVSNSLFLLEFTCCNRLWEFSVIKPLCYKDVFVNSFCSPTFKLANSLLVKTLPLTYYLNVFWILSQHHPKNDNRECQNSVYSFGSLVDIDNLI